MKPRVVVPGNPGHHAVQFYSDDDRLCVSVADFLGDGIAAGQPTIVIATPAHRDRIISELTKRRFDVEALERSGSVALLDAADTLQHFMIDGRPDTALFREVIGNVIDRVVA